MKPLQFLLSNNLEEINHSDLHVGMRVFVDGTDLEAGYGKNWHYSEGVVIRDFRYDTEEPIDGVCIAFNDWTNGHEGQMKEDKERCGENRCWSFYRDDYENNIDNVKFYVINSYDFFDTLTEEENFDWVEDVKKMSYTFGDIKEFLEDGDKISITGNICDDVGRILLKLDDEPFEVSHVRGEFSMNMFWLRIPSERPEGWYKYSNGEAIHFGVECYKFDKLLEVEIIEKNGNHLNESDGQDLDWVQDIVDQTNKISKYLIPGQYFIVKKESGNINYDLIIRIDDYGRIIPNPDDKKDDGNVIIFSSFNYENKGIWEHNEKVELYWAQFLVEEDGYWMPITKERAEEIIHLNGGTI